VRNFIDDFSGTVHSESEYVKVANKMYDAIKEEGSTQILGHLMRVRASHYFFALSHLCKISIDNLFLLLISLITRFSPINFPTHIYRIFFHRLCKGLFPTRELSRD
jgi:hypothetical protein